MYNIPTVAVVQYKKLQLFHSFKGKFTNVKIFDEYVPDQGLTFLTKNFEAKSFDHQPEIKMEEIKILKIS